MADRTKSRDGQVARQISLFTKVPKKLSTTALS
jgi:hypothetical protein